MLKDIVMLNDYNQGTIINNPSHYNDNINDIEKLSIVLLEILSSSHNTQLKKEEN